MATQQQSKGLKKLLEDQLADLYYVEMQLVKTLPKMAKAAMNGDLQAAFEEHLKETQGHVTQLEGAFAAMGKPAKGKKCPAIDGILAEGKELMDGFKGDPALDAALVSAAQKVEHYEITSYGSAHAWAEQLELEEVAKALEAILEEEKAADEKLTELARSVVNVEADVEEGEEEEEEVEAKGSKTSTARAPAKKKQMSRM